MLKRYERYDDVALGDNLYTPVENAIYEVTGLSLIGNVLIHRCGYYENYVDLERTISFPSLKQNFFKIV